MIMNNLKPDLQRCKNLLAAGFSLLTVGEGKQPNIKWKEYQTTQISSDSFENFYNLNNTHGVGIITGFDGLEVIDVDLKVLSTLKEREEFWTEYLQFLKDNIEDFEDKFIICKTMNSGYHLLYKCSKISGNQKIAKPKGVSQALIESRGVGGYVFVYSNFVQGSGYADIKTISEEDREILWSTSKYYDYVENVENSEKKYKDAPREHHEAEIKVWDDFNSKNSVWDLIRTEFDIVKNLSNKTVIRRNGAKSPHSGYIFDNSKCMYLFSTGTIYPAEKLLSPFCVYAYQKHFGNFSDAAKDLYKQGYGSRFKKTKLPDIKKIDLDLDLVETKSDTDEFPIEIFPKEIITYITEIQHSLNASTDYLGSAFLWVLSLCVGNSIKIEIKNGWTEAGVVWIAIVGKAGIGKTHNLQSIVRPLLQINEREIKRYNESLKNYQEYQEMDKKDKEKFFPEKLKEPRKTQFIVGDITIESFFDHHDQNQNGIGIFRDELSGWIKDLNKYRPGSDLETYLSCWSNSSISINRKTSKNAYVSNAYVPIIGGVQPSILASHYTEENKDNGFIDRILLCYPDLVVDRFSEAEIDKELLSWYDEYIQAFYDEIRYKVLEYDDFGNIRPHIFRFSKEAKAEYVRIFDKITDLQNSDTENEYMKSMLPKQKSYVARFALLLHIFYKFSGQTSESYICKEAVLAAEKLSDYFIKMAKKNKFESIEKKEITAVVKQSGKITAKEKFLVIYESNKKFNRSKVAEELNVSRQTIFLWVKEIEQNVKKV